MLKGAWDENQDAIQRNSEEPGGNRNSWCRNIPEGLSPHQGSQVGN